jgi:hypothetical protein
MSSRIDRIRALRTATQAPLVQCVKALDACQGDGRAAARWLAQQITGFFNPPRVVVSYGAVAVERTPDRRAAAMVCVVTPESYRDDDGPYLTAKRAARVALRDGEAAARACADGPWAVHRVVRVEAGEGGVLATSTGLSGDHAVIVEVASQTDDARVARFADSLAVRANLGGARWLRRAEVPAGHRRQVGDVLEAQWSGADEAIVADVERRLAGEVTGLRVVRLVRMDVREEAQAAWLGDRSLWR